MDTRSYTTDQTHDARLRPTPEFDGTAAPGARIIPSGDGDVFDMTPVERFVWKATAATTGGAFDAFETSMQPGYPGAPEHAHDANEEIFYVLEGTFRFKLGDEIFPAPAGAFVYVPRGTPHTWVNADQGVSRMLTLFLPGGMQGFFEETSPLVQADPPDFAALAEAAGRYDTRVLGPPLVPERAQA
jgi:mannose-6-phosphate isomerase-like protein (cupin superfamily)